MQTLIFCLKIHLLFCPVFGLTSFIKNSTQLCKCSFTGAENATLSCDLSILDSCFIETKGVKLLLVENKWDRWDEKDNLDSIHLLNEDSHLEHLQFSNVPFEAFGKFVSHRFFPKVTSVKSWSSTSGQIFDCDDKIEIHKDFMSNLSLAVPNLLDLSMENAGLCRFTPPIDNHHDESSLNFVDLRRLKTKSTTKWSRKAA